MITICCNDSSICVNGWGGKIRDNFGDLKEDRLPYSTERFIALCARQVYYEYQRQLRDHTILERSPLPRPFVSERLFERSASSATLLQCKTTLSATTMSVTTIDLTAPSSTGTSTIAGAATSGTEAVGIPAGEQGVGNDATGSSSLGSSGPPSRSLITTPTIDTATLSTPPVPIIAPTAAAPPITTTTGLPSAPPPSQLVPSPGHFSMYHEGMMRSTATPMLLMDKPTTIVMESDDKRKVELDAPAPAPAPLPYTATTTSINNGQVVNTSVYDLEKEKEIAAKIRNCAWVSPEMERMVLASGGDHYLQTWGRYYIICLT
jgi:hypothetical protein